MGSDAVDSILNQRDVYAQAEIAMNVDDDDLVDFFMYVVREENMQYPPLDWMNARIMFERILELSGS